MNDGWSSRSTLASIFPAVRTLRIRIGGFKFNKVKQVRYLVTMPCRWIMTTIKRTLHVKHISYREQILIIMLNDLKALHVCKSVYSWWNHKANWTHMTKTHDTNHPWTFKNSILKNHLPKNQPLKWWYFKDLCNVTNHEYVRIGLEQSTVFWVSNFFYLKDKL